MIDDPNWTQQYRPSTLEDCILPFTVKEQLEKFINTQDLPNLILSGPAGCGKTTAAMALVNQLEYDYIIINGSMNGDIDTLRVDIKNYASTVSFSGTRKIIILDEADYLSTKTQAGLRNFMEEYSKNAGFILTCNFPNRIIEPLHSRCAIIDFRFPKNERQEAAAQIFKRLKNILKSKDIKYDNEVLAQVVTKYFPDFRKTINELQKYSVSGQIDTGILAAGTDSEYTDLLDALQDKNFTKMRKWVGENYSSDNTTIFTELYNVINTKIAKSNIPQLILLCAQYDYKHSFVTDKEINVSAFLVEVMSDCY